MSETTAWVSHSLAKDATEDNAGYHGLAWRAQEPALRLVRDVHDGTFALRDGVYLRQFPRESDESFRDRKNESVLFNATRATVRGWTGMVYRKDPTLSDDVPEALREDLDNIDFAGRDLATFGRDVFHDKELDGHGHVFVDWHGPDNPATLRDEEAEARPYAVHITKEQVIRFRSESRGGNTVLTMFAYIETETVPDGNFVEKEVERVRQYDLQEVVDPETGEEQTRVRYRAWVRDKGQAGEWAPEEDDDGAIIDTTLGPRMTRIPLVTDYADRTGFMTSNPPALDLAQQNLRHFRLSSDRDDSLHKVLQAVFVVSGVEAEEIGEMVTDHGLALPDTEMGAAYVEPQGNGLQHAREELQDIERRMQALGLQALVQHNRGQRTATEQRMEKAERDSDLAQSAKAHQAALQEVLDLMAMWRGIDTAGQVEVNVDFDTLVLDPQMITALEKLVPEKLSLETFWDIMAQGEVLPDTFDAATEKERIAEGGIGELQAFLEMVQARQQEGAGGQEADGDSNAGGDDEDESRAA